MPVVFVDLPAAPRVKDPVAFTCALWARVEAGQADRPVSVAALRRAVPFQHHDPLALPPAFFHALHRITDALNRAEAS